jgi:putative hydrolases of HD superfamily
MLPRDQSQLFQELWEEFEERKTPEACFAASLDRLQPLLHNYHTKGISWQEHGVSEDRVLKRNCHIQDGSPRLWQYAQGLIADAVDKGYLQGSGKSCQKRKNNRSRQ